ncbi:Ubiquitin carboxyl-terminal hydrolase 17 [Striga hermonthica]|uniref:Ubiquitin carboxyl-terminal hydrolase n=1 Tax=Striga hermonthica TaxID=68872 RepID=A0A9N7RKA8_STRHE|nr:Ubiquitin carboxyl-terminal hydrolase 17 [Striga hermonthica]
MLVIVGILLIFGLVVRFKWKNGAAKKEEILRLAAVASEEEEKIARLQSFEEYNSPPTPHPQLERQSYCAVCHCPTTTRCSRCKAARYCSGKCQIIHWRQGHKDECRPATSPGAGYESGYDMETASENLSATLLQNEVKMCSDASQEFNDSRSSSSSSSCFYSSIECSESSFDASTSEVLEFGTSIQLDKAPAVCTRSHMSKPISLSGDADVPNPSPPVYSKNHTPGGSKMEKTKADESLGSTNTRDKRKGDGVAVLEEFGQGGNELRSARSSIAARASSAEQWKNLAQLSANKVTRSIRSPGNRGMPNVESYLECSKSLKMPPSDEYLGRESQVCYSNVARSMPTTMSTGNCQKLPMKADNHHVISSEIEGVRNMPEDISKSLKTSVRKFVQHFKAPKQSNMVKDLGGPYNHKIIFPIKLFMQLYSCDDVELHPYGLVNCGNSCYANAVLQCLTFTRPIASYLLHRVHSKTCRKTDWCFICTFEHLIQKGQAMDSPLSPVGLLSQIQPIGREEDAHEFLRNVVDKMQSICLEEAGASGSLSEGSTLMGLTFGGYLRSKIKCMKCSGRSERFDRMMDLTVEIDGSICTLEDALMQFTMSETLGGDDKYKCSRCKSYEKAKKKLTVLEAPNVLTVVLKRFRAGNLEKLNKHVKFPEVLNLSPYMSGMNDKCPIYQLYAVVVHLGKNAAYSGHYVSYVRDFHGDWFKIDDSLVSRVDLETVLSVEAYILFYARHSPRGASLVRSTSNHYDMKTKRNTEAISSGNNSKKKNTKIKPNSSCRYAGPTSPHEVSGKHHHWMSPNDFNGDHAVGPKGWGLHKSKSLLDSSSSDSSSIFSTSDAGSYSTDSTKDSSVEDISGYLFGSTSWYNPQI